MGLSNSSNHLRTARINLIHAGAASRIAEMDAMKQNISEAETRIKQSQESFTAYMNRAVRTAEGSAGCGSEARYDAYIAGMQPMLKLPKTACSRRSSTTKTKRRVRWMTLTTPCC
jgi:methyl-accepting chemotaxis protein-3 (ribose and galactose sensor receptor)